MFKIDCDYFHFQFRIKIWSKYNEVMIDSGDIKDLDIRGGKLGVMSFSQEKCIWSAISTRCLGKCMFCTFLCFLAGIVFAWLQNNWPIGHFRVSLVPLFQNESKCETIQMKMSLICMKMNR